MTAAVRDGQRDQTIGTETASEAMVQGQTTKSASPLLPATAWSIVVLSLLVTSLIWYSTNRFVIRRAHDRFQFQTEEVKSSLLERMTDYQMALRGGTGLFKASTAVERDEWRAYVNSLDIQDFYPGIQGLGYSQVIEPAKLPQHEAAIRAQGFPDYRVNPPGDRPLYTAIIYLEPFDWRNQRAFGYDMFSEPVRRAAMELARDSGVVAISGKVTLVQETEQDLQNGFLMYQPVYQNGWPITTVNERRAALTGYVYSPFRVNNLMTGVVGHTLPHLAFSLFDGEQANAASLLYETVATPAERPASRATAPLFERTLRLGMGGRTWTLHLYTLPGYIPATQARLPLLFAFAGLGAFFLLYLYIHALARQAQADRMSATLRDSEERYRTLVEFAPDAIVVIDEQGRIRDCNPAFELFFGYRTDELMGKNINLLIPPPDHNAHDDHLARYLSGGEGKSVRVGRDVEVRRKDGSSATIHLRVGEQRLADGSRRFIGFIRDLTERLRAEALVRQRKALFRSVVATSSDGFWITDLEGHILEVNDAYCRLSGYTPEELLGMRIQDLEANESPEQTAAHIERILRLGSDLFESRHRAKDGHLWPVEVSVTHAAVPEDRMVAFCRDISERKHYESELEGYKQHLERLVEERTAELKEAEQRARLILESSGDGLYGVDIQGRFTFVNPAACHLLGYTQEALVGAPVHPTIHHSHPDGRPFPVAECHLHEEHVKGKVVRIDCDTFWRADGQPLHVSVSSQPMWLDGNIVGAVVSFTDIHERLEAETALRRQAEELRAQYEAVEKFNRIMVGRELDMIRLKRQVNELAGQLGQAHPYDLSLLDHQAPGGSS